MKNWIKKINENKFQFFFFIGILAFLFVSLIIIGATNNDPVDELENRKANIKDKNIIIILISNILPCLKNFSRLDAINNFKNINELIKKKAKYKIFNVKSILSK